MKLPIIVCSAVSVSILSFAEPVSPLTVKSEKAYSVYSVEDSPNMFLFHLEHPDAPAEITIRPRQFQIRKGERYFINHSESDAPFRIKAEDNGVLTFTRPAEIRTAFAVLPPHPNLLAGAGNDFTIGKKENATVNSVLIGKIPVQSGIAYRGSFFYHQTSGTPDCAIGLILRVRKNGKVVLTANNRYLHSFPLLKNSASQPRYCEEEIKVPAAPGKYELETAVEISAAPGSFRITHPEIIKAPPLLRHKGKISHAKLLADPKRIFPEMKSRPVLTPEIRNLNGLPRLFVNGKSEIFLPIQAESEEQIRDAYAAGYRVFMVTFAINNWGRRQGSAWLGKGKYDWTALDGKLARVLELAPDARILLFSYGLAYAGFADEHPESKWVTDTGKTDIIFLSSVREKAYSIVGETTRRECGTFFYELGRHLAASPLGKNIIGYHISGASDGQWYQPERPWHHKNLDYSEATRKAVCEEIRELYNNDIQALRKAWEQPDATFETLQTPHKKELESPDFLLDPDNPRHRRLIEWVQADQKALIHAIDSFAASFKKGFRRPVLVSTYAPDNRFIDRTTLFRSTHLDGFVYLGSYLRPRKSGGNGGCFYPVASGALHGKFILEEIDFRNQYFGYVAARRHRLYGMADDDPAYIGQLLRSFGACWTQGGSGWLRPIGTDSYLCWTGYYRRHIELLMKAAQNFERIGSVEKNTDLILFFGDDYQTYLSWKKQFCHFMDYVSRANLKLPQSGLRFRRYILSDLEIPGKPKAKVYLFAGCASMTQSQIDYICKNLQKDGNILIFSNDAGRCSPGGFTGNLYRLTGIRALLHPDKMVPGIYSEKKVNKFGINDLPFMGVWMRSFELPEIVIDPAGTERIADLPSGLPGAVLKRHANWSAVYTAGSMENLTSPDFWSFITKLAGIRRGTAQGDVLYTGNGISVIHAVTDGGKTIPAAKGKMYYDAVSGTALPILGSRISFPMKYGETRLILETSHKPDASKM